MAQERLWDLVQCVIGSQMACDNQITTDYSTESSGNRNLSFLFCSCLPQQSNSLRLNGPSWGLSDGGFWKLESCSSFGLRERCPLEDVKNMCAAGSTNRLVREIRIFPPKSRRDRFFKKVSCGREN